VAAYRYIVCDVFTTQRFEGNQLAVFPDAEGLTDEQMQTIARELNLSETSFVFAAQDPYLARLRIFTPFREIAFAGHPTIGTAFVLTMLGRVPANVESFVLGEVGGDVPVRLEGRDNDFMAWLSTPPMHFGATFDPAECARFVGLRPEDVLANCTPQLVGVSTPFLYVAVRDAAAVDRARLDESALYESIQAAELNGVFIFAPTKKGAYSRMFAPMSGITEDPATGSATGPLGAYMAQCGLIESRDGIAFISEQGTKMHRRSILHARLRCDNAGTIQTVEVGGSAILVAEATMHL
jgi:trans-2,3-dihydro-3-hydroxyanthranilate isomerase